MKNILFSLVTILLAYNLNAQQTFSSSDPAYIKNVQAGEAALNAEKYDSCLVYYEEAFKIKQTSVLSTLRAAAGYMNSGVSVYITGTISPITWIP